MNKTIKNIIITNTIVIIFVIVFVVSRIREVWDLGILILIFAGLMLIEIPIMINLIIKNKK